GAPVDPPDPVACPERAKIGELEPLAFLPRDAVAGEELSLAGSDELSQLFRTRVDAQHRRSIERPLPGEQARGVARPQMDLAEAVGPPACAPEPKLEQTVLAGVEAQRDRILSLDQLEPARNLDQELEARRVIAGVELDLDYARAADLDVDARVRLSRERQANGEQDREGHGDQRQLGTGKDQRRQQSE